MLSKSFKKATRGSITKTLENTKGFINKNKTEFSQKAKKGKKKSKKSEKKKAYHDDEMLQIRKINRRTRFDSDPRPMQQKLAIWKHNEGSERRRKEVNVQQRPPHGGRRR